jgi:hypothetical protein
MSKDNKKRFDELNRKRVKNSCGSFDKKEREDWERLSNLFVEETLGTKAVYSA